VTSRAFQDSGLFCEAWRRGLEHREFFRNRTDDELVQRRSIFLREAGKRRAYLRRDADVWPDRDWTQWPPFPQLEQKVVRDCVASFPRSRFERDRRPEPLTREEQLDAEAIAAKIRLGVYRADWV
jgi:hypothetical protein